MDVKIDLHSLSMVALVAATCCVSLTQDANMHPERMILGSVSGARSDTESVLLRDRFFTSISRTSLVHNRPAAPSNIAANDVAKLPPNSIVVHDKSSAGAQEVVMARHVDMTLSTPAPAMPQFSAPEVLDKQMHDESVM